MNALLLADSLGMLGDCLVRQGRPADAEPALRQSLAIWEAKETGGWRAENVRSRLGEALVRQQRFADAEPLLLSAYDALRQRQNRIPSLSRARVLRHAGERIVQLYVALGKPEEAAKWTDKLRVPEPPPTGTSPEATP